ncbi:hypothetical protein NPX13_g8568 [Xylaria arbuscula]|uniref:Uncharacterized protein n=1 Tax=Xylaria arbuscula TaxID=114810 RepID=A0A9W8TJQ1_9PEZI|nr:hypothetical protein NPX13_g8568 [Xylaria arbuscula]
MLGVLAANNIRVSNPMTSLRRHAACMVPTADIMALELYIPPCIRSPIHPHHPPPPDKPLRIQIEGPLVAVERLFPNIQWHVEGIKPEFPQPAGLKLAELTYSLLYGRKPSPDIQGDLVVRNEYLDWLVHPRPVQEKVYYGLTFDHLVPPDDYDPEVLQINIIEIEDDNGVYANKYMPFYVDPADKFKALHRRNSKGERQKSIGQLADQMATDCMRHSTREINALAPLHQIPGSAVTCQQDTHWFKYYQD